MAEHKRKTSILESLATIASLVLIIGVIGFLLWESRQEDTPPSIGIKALNQRHSGDNYYVSVELRNEGRQTAREVQVRGKLMEGEKEAAEADTTVDWLPGKSTRHATLIFTEDPTSHTMKLSVAGYDSP